MLAGLRRAGGARFLGGVVIPTLIIGAMYAWVFVDRSDDPVNFIANPLDRPFPTAVGVAAIALVVVLSIDGMNSYVAEVFGTTTGALFPYLFGMTLLVPPLEGGIVYWVLRRRRRRRDGAENDPGVADS